MEAAGLGSSLGRIERRLEWEPARRREGPGTGNRGAILPSESIEGGIGVGDRLALVKGRAERSFSKIRMLAVCS